MRSLSVLVVDDCHDNADLLTLLLRGEGHTVATAYSGSAALEFLDKSCPEVVLLDLIMPPPDGIETCRRIKAFSDRVIVIAITGYPDQSLHAKAISHGCCEVILKPLDLERIYEVLRRFSTSNAGNQSAPVPI